MSTIDLYKQHFSNDGGLWIVPDRIQQTGDQVSERPTEICEQSSDGSDLERQEIMLVS